MTSGRRAARAIPMAMTLVLLTLAGHTAGQGALPSSTGLILVVGLALALSFAVSDRRSSFGRMIVYLLAAQALLHLIVTVTGHAHAGAGSAGVLPGAAVLAGHLAAGFTAALILTLADDLIERWLAYVGHLLGVPALGLAAHGEPAARLVIAEAPRPAALRSLLHQVERRGPPCAPTTAFA